MSIPLFLFRISKWNNNRMNKVDFSTHHITFFITHILGDIFEGKKLYLKIDYLKSWTLFTNTLKKTYSPKFTYLRMPKLLTLFLIFESLRYSPPLKRRMVSSIPGRDVTIVILLTSVIRHL